MGQTGNGCDTSQDDYQSSPSAPIPESAAALPKHLFLKIVAVMVLVVAVRVAVMAAMSSGGGEPSHAQERDSAALHATYRDHR